MWDRTCYEQVLSIDVDDVVEDKRVCLVFSGAELPFPRLRLERQMAVSMTDDPLAVRSPDAHVEDYRLSLT